MQGNLIIYGLAFYEYKDRPRILNKHLSKQVIEILDNKKVKSFVQKIIGFSDEIL